MFALFKLLILLVATLAIVNSVDARPMRAKRCTVKASSSGSVSAQNVEGDPSPPSSSSSAPPPASSSPAPSGGSGSGQFPSPNFNTPKLAADGTPGVPLSSWWAPRSSEYAFMGFGYDVGACYSVSAMTASFKQMKTYGARYVRMYNACDKSGFMDDIVQAGYNAGLGIYALTWFGFTGGTQYKSRLAAIVNTIENNPLAPYVIRNLVIGSEPLFDNAISVPDLVSLIKATKPKVEKFGVQVSVSEMVHGYQERDGSNAVLQAIDHVESNTLPFFSSAATTGNNAWPQVNSDITFFKGQTSSSKKIMLTENGWPSNQDVWHANAASAVASISSEKGYYDMLDSKCTTLKSLGPQGGVGWFAHIWEDQTLSGWGIVNGGKPKFDFSARTHC